MKNFQHEKDPVVESMPADWDSEQQKIAKDAIAILLRCYPGYAWGLEFSPQVGLAQASLIIRLTDVPTDVVYIVNYKDMDFPDLKIIMRAGGEFLEALGLSRSRNRHDEVRGLKTTPSGLVIPAHAAMPSTNQPGYDKLKADNERYNP
jgi:hypothetical protein